jgi:ribulose kinase
MVFFKLRQILDEAPKVYDAMDRFIEAADWTRTWRTSRHNAQSDRRRRGLQLGINRNL